MKIVSHYNKNMGGIDLMDQRKVSYVIYRKWSLQFRQVMAQGFVTARQRVVSTSKTSAVRVWTTQWKKKYKKKMR